MGRNEHFIEGFHGRTDGRDPREVHDLYVAPQRDYADDWAHDPSGHGTVHKVSYEAENPLHFTRAEEFHNAWHDSGAHSTPGRFHPDSTRVFTDWARQRGHDAVILHPQLFDDPEASQEHWETAAGTFGDPQSIILNPKKAKVDPA